MSYSIYVDGGSKNNGSANQKAYFSFVIYKITDGKDIVIDRQSTQIGNETNNSAEYQALIAAMKRVEELNIKTAVFYTDSALIYGHLFRGWNISPKFVRLVEMVSSYLRKNSHWLLLNVKREYIVQRLGH